MATRRGKSQARRNTSDDSGMPGWAWLVIGLALGVGIFLMAPKLMDGGGAESFFRPKPNADAQPPAMDAVDNEPIVSDNNGATATSRSPDAADSGKGKDAKGQDYDFYTLLPAEEVALSDTELAARARAEDAQRRAAEQAAAKPNPDAANAATPLTVPPAIDNASPATNPAKDIATARKPPAGVAGDAHDDARYLLQAGAFAASGDAEALKAKIAFLGLSARVESAQIKGDTVYRVRMGPYGTATELAEAKQKLSGGGLPALAIKAK